MISYLDEELNGKIERYESWEKTKVFTQINFITVHTRRSSCKGIFAPDAGERSMFIYALTQPS